MSVHNILKNLQNLESMYPRQTRICMNGVVRKIGTQLFFDL